jgi:hypothetical protein
MDNEEPEITPEMIEAGASVLCGFETLTASEGYWAELVYRAMYAVKMKANVASSGETHPQATSEETERRATEALPRTAGLVDRIAEIISQHTGMYVVSAHGIALEILALIKADTNEA